MIFNWTKEDSFNLKRIADALCQLASIEVVDKNHQPTVLAVEVHDESLEAMAEREAEENSDKVKGKLNENNDRFWPEDNLTLEELDNM